MDEPGTQVDVDLYEWRIANRLEAMDLARLEHHVFNRAFNQLTPDSLQYINRLIVQTAIELGLEDGDKLRVDTTVDVATFCYTSLCL